MDYTMAETIAYRLSKLSPWEKYAGGRGWTVCKFCEMSKNFGDTGTHAPECLWLNARQYIELRNAPVASQEPQESPVESRVSELLSESEIDPEIAAAHQAIPTWRLV